MTSSKIKVNYVTPVLPALASFRLRVQTASKWINENSPDIITNISPSVDVNADVNFFYKHFNPEETIKQMSAAQRGGSRVIFDITDNHFMHPTLGEYYSTACDYADIITCPTSKMQYEIKKETGRIATIIVDPITFPTHPPKAFSDLPSLAWFGHISNFPSLYPYLGVLPFPLTVYTNASFANDMTDVNFRQWEPGILEEELHTHDIVILPNNNKPCSSPNRAVDSIMSGCYVVSDNLAVNSVVDTYSYIGDIFKGLDFYFTNYNLTIRDRIKQGQQTLPKIYGAEVVAKDWENIFRKVIKLYETA